MPSNEASSNSSIDMLSVGLLTKFASFRDLEVQLEEINQQDLIQTMSKMNGDLIQNEEIMEVQLMMKKLNLYRRKLKMIKSEMLYIAATSQLLLKKAISMQDIKVNEKAEKLRKIDYEVSLVGRPKTTT